MGSWIERSEPYVAAVEAAGMEARVLSTRHFFGEEGARAALQGLDGVVLAGGGDINPELLGCADVHPTVADVETPRDVFEKAVFQRAWEAGMPMLCICRGMQVMNWVLGGTLHPDIDACVAPHGRAKYHRQTEHGKARHEIGHSIEVLPDTRLAEIFGAGRLQVNTIHHQALDRLAPGLIVSAVAPDGVIEGVEAPERPFALGVQYHPEAMFRHHPEQLKLFRALAGACAMA